MDKASPLSRKADARRPEAARAARQRGAVAIIVGLSLAVLVGFAGLVLDLGRLFINKSELQSAADACALAAAKELSCDTSVSGSCTANYLKNARYAGIYVAGRNQRDFQKSAVIIAPTDVRFSTALAPNSGYLPVGADGVGADPKSKFAMCVARSTGIIPWFMGVLGLSGANDVTAMAVATRAPSAMFCDALPFGICSSATGSTVPPYDLRIGQWLKSDLSGPSNDLTGAFRWIDYQSTAGGTPDLERLLAGQDHFCEIKIGDNVIENGGKQGVKDAYNTRFGLYGPAPKFTPTNAPPDRTGYAYPTQHPPATFAIDYSAATNGMPSPPASAPGQSSAYPHYQSAQENNTPFSATDYPPVGLKRPAGSPGGYAQGVTRRVVATPIISCTGNQNTIKALACVLMLNPMGSQGSGDTILYLEYLGLATDEGSPCGPYGTAGGAGGDGPMVPTLVQ